MSRKLLAEEPRSRPVWEALEAYARARIQEFVQVLLEDEVTELLGRAKSERRAPGEPTSYRNAYGKPRRVALTSGTITIQRPRVRGLDERFESRVLPLFQRRTEEVGALLPQLYLHGLALGDFELALRGLLGEGAPLSAASLVRLKAQWQQEYERCRQRSLEGLDVVYGWADGLYVKAGVEGGKAALLVVIGATDDGQKQVLAVESGERESVESWLRVADGHLGIWGAVAQLWPQCGEQRCWNHKLLNVLDQVPRKRQPAVKAWLRRLMYAETREECEQLRRQCVAQFRKLFPKAMQTLERDWERLITYYEFPEHWTHLRTTNVIESPFAAVRLRTSAAKRFKRVENACALIWKLLGVAEKTFRKLNAPHLLKDVAAGMPYVNGIAVHSKRVAA